MGSKIEGNFMICRDNRVNQLYNKLKMKSTKSNPFLTYHSLVLCKAERSGQFRQEQSVSGYIFRRPFMSKLQMSASQQKRSNFINDNKRNLKNFFSDRIQYDHIKIMDKQIQFSPAEILSMRKYQHQKQQATKIKFNTSVDLQNIIEKQDKNGKFINQYFKVVSGKKTKNFKDHGKCNLIAKKNYSTLNYRTHTENSVMKCAQTLKNTAYNSVFGGKEKSKGDQLREKEEWQKRGKTEKTRRKRRSPVRQKKQLGDIIVKLQDFYSKVNTNNFQLLMRQQSKQSASPQNPQNSHTEKLQKVQKQILQFIRVSSDGCRKQNTKMLPMKRIQDLQKMDNVYYRKMVNHKKNRLWIRCQALNHANMTEFWRTSGRNQGDEEKELDIQGKESVEDLSSGRKRLDIDTRLKNRSKVYSSSLEVETNKYSTFGEFLIHSLHTAKRYNIKIQNIYNIIFKKRKPFELEGSYVLFKLIKNNNRNMFHRFIVRNTEYANQIDYSNRSCLIYAVENNSIGIIEQLLKVGINVDYRDGNGVNALMHAIMKNNYCVVELLLKNGASPWSQQHCRISRLLLGCDNRIKMLIKNARRIHIGQQLKSKIKDKIQFWNLYKNQIQGDVGVQFL